MLNWWLWTPLLPLLTGERDVLAPTLPGHLGGPTLSKPSPPYIKPLVDFLEAELDAAGFDRVDVVGNSLGGWCALELARRGRARRVVAIAPVGMHTQQQGLRWVSQFDRGRDLARRTSWISAIVMASPAVRRKALALLTADGGLLPAMLVRELVLSIADCDLPDFFAALLASGAQVPMIEAAEEIDVPVLVVWANGDRLVSGDQIDRYLAALPNAQTVELDGLGHCPQLEDPQRVAAEVLRFGASG
jgi:pimeloyl-ACP methyl ester carboxylesterase